MPRITVTIESSDGSRVTFDGAASAAYGSTQEEFHAALQQDAVTAVTQYVMLESARAQTLIAYGERDRKAAQ